MTKSEFIEMIKNNHIRLCKNAHQRMIEAKQIKLLFKKNLMNYETDNRN